MEFIDFMNMRLEDVSVNRKYEYSTYAGYKSNINIRMKEFFGSSKNMKIILMKINLQKKTYL